MVRVTIELLPRGSEAHKRHLGTVLIANTGAQGPGPVGDYTVTCSMRGRPDQVWKSAEVLGFPRKRLGAYDLLFRALRNVVGFRNP